MRILCSRFAQEVGGAERSFFAHLSAYEKLGHEVVAVTNLEVPSNVGVIVERVWWFKHRSKLYKALVALPQLLQAAWLVRKHRIDIINPHSRFSHIVFSLSKPLHRKPVVWKDALEIAEHLDKSRKGLAKSIYELALRQADAIYTLSADQRTQLLSRTDLDDATAEKISVIPSGLDFSKYDLEAEPAIERGGLVLGYAARIHEQKGIQYLLEAMSLLKDRLPDMSLVIVGEGDYRSTLEQMSRDFSIETCVDFVDFQEDISPYLRSFDIFVCPSLYETWGISVHEARLFGLPIIACDVGALPEQIEDGESGLLVPPADPEVLAGAIEKLAGDESLRKRLGESARRSALEMGDFTKTVDDKLITLLESFVHAE